MPPSLPSRRSKRTQHPSDREFFGDTCTINAVSGQLLHVFLNLVVNAKQAIGVGKAGQITLRCKSLPEQVICEIEAAGRACTGIRRAQL